MAHLWRILEENEMNGTWCTCYDFEGLPRNTVALFGFLLNTWCVNYHRSRKWLILCSLNGPFTRMNGNLRIFQGPNGNLRIFTVFPKYVTFTKNNKNTQNLSQQENTSPMHKQYAFCIMLYVIVALKGMTLLVESSLYKLSLVWFIYAEFATLL